MARLNLAAELGDLAKNATEEKPVRKPATPKATAPAAKAQSAPKPKKDESTTSAMPLFLQLERKEARLREDQIEWLAVHAKRLQRAKGRTGGGRITDNTLIRVAVDLLIAHGDKLAGATEAELRQSVLDDNP